MRKLTKSRMSKKGTGVGKPASVPGALDAAVSGHVPEQGGLRITRRCLDFIL